MVGGGFLGGVAGGAVISVIIRGVDRFSNVAKGIEGRASKLGKTFNVLGKVAKVGLGVAAVAVGALGTAMFKGVGIANDYETAMANVSTLMESGADATEVFGKEMDRLIKTLPLQNAQLQLSEGLYQTISAGITDTTEAMVFLEKATETAIGGSANLSKVIEAGSKTMISFGLETSESGRVFDAMAATVKAGQTTMEQLAQALPIVAGSAGEMNATLEETLGVMAGLTKVFKSPEIAAERLRTVFVSLNKPTKDLEDLFKKIGVTSGQQAIEQFGLVGTIEKLNEATEGNSQVMAKALGSSEAFQVAQSVLGKASESVAESIKIVGDATGLVEDQFSKMADTTESKATLAMNNFSLILRDVGDATKEHIVGPLLEGALPLLEKFSGFMTNFSENLLPKVIEFFKKLGASFKKGLSVVDAELFKNLWEKIVNFFSDNRKMFEDIFQFLGSAIGKMVNNAGKFIEILIDSGALKLVLLLFEGIAVAFNIIANVGGFVLDLITKIVNAIKNFKISKIIDIISGFISQVASFLTKKSEKVENVDDFILRPGQSPIHVNPEDTIVGFKGDSPIGTTIDKVEIIIQGAGKNAMEIGREVQERLSALGKPVLGI